MATKLSAFYHTLPRPNPAIRRVVQNDRPWTRPYRPKCRVRVSISVLTFVGRILGGAQTNLTSAAAPALHDAAIRNLVFARSIT